MKKVSQASSKTLLRIDSSLAGSDSMSSQLMDQLIVGLSQHQHTNVVHRQLANESVPHLDSEWISSLMGDKTQLTDEQKVKRNYSDEQINQVKEADIIVIGAPMYNFSVPSVLKAWFDHIARAGETFRYTANGPEGLLTNKKVYLVTTRGGIHAGKPSDTLIPFVENFLSFVGLTDVEVIFAEGLNMNSASREKGIESAKNKIESILAA